MFSFITLVFWVAGELGLEPGPLGLYQSWPKPLYGTEVGPCAETWLFFCFILALTFNW